MNETLTAPPLLTRPAALRDGLTDHDIRLRRLNSEWTPLRPGSYIPAPARTVTPLDRHRRQVEAALAVAAPDAVASHASAAVLHGLPLWRVPLDRVHVTRPGAGGGHRRGLLHTHRADLEPDDIVLLGGRPTTSLARTVADLARTLTREQAVMVGDAALRSTLVRHDEIAAALARARRRHGARRAQAVVAFLDARSESPGESRSRVIMDRFAIPTPTLQYEVRAPDGGLVGRSDYGWEEFGVLGEFDGAAKYTRYLRPGEQPGDAVFREKQREDALRRLGWLIIRWIWSELDHPEVFIARLLAALDRIAR